MILSLQLSRKQRCETPETCLEATAELSSGQVKHSSDAIFAGGGQVLAVWGYNHGIKAILRGMQGGGWAPLGVG